MDETICIFGIGGFGREVLCCLIDSLAGTGKRVQDAACFMVGDEFLKERSIMGVPVIPMSQMDVGKHKIVVAVGEPKSRRQIVNSLPADTQFASIIHPSAVISEWVDISHGSVVTAGCILTCNIQIGKHAHINLNTTIGHDCVIGDYLTTAPGVCINGNCHLGHNVYLGSNSCIKQGIHIPDNTTIGMGGVVVKNIKDSGIYVGNPVRKIDTDN